MVKKQPSSVTLLGTKIVMCLIEKLNLDLIKSIYIWNLTWLLHAWQTNSNLNVKGQNFDTMALP